MAMIMNILVGGNLILNKCDNSLITNKSENKNNSKS